MNSILDFDNFYSIHRHLLAPSFQCSTDYGAPGNQVYYLTSTSTTSAYSAGTLLPNTTAVTPFSSIPRAVTGTSFSSATATSDFRSEDFTRSAFDNDMSRYNAQRIPCSRTKYRNLDFSAAEPMQSGYLSFVPPVLPSSNRTLSIVSTVLSSLYIAELVAPSPEQSTSVERAIASIKTFIEKSQGARQAFSRTWRRLDRLVEESAPEDGYESQFSEEFFDSLSKNGSDLLSTYTALKSTGRLSIITQCETLKVLGRAQHRGTHMIRLKTLIDGLRDDRPAVRDSAAIGLSYMEDRTSASLVKAAASEEPKQNLRRYMLAVARELESTEQDVIASAKGAA